MACLLDAAEGWKLLISKGETIEMPTCPCYAPQFHFKHDTLKVKEYVRRVADEGVAHHVCLVMGDYVEQLKLYAYYSGIDVVEI